MIYESQPTYYTEVDSRVRADANDPTSGYLDTKVDTTTVEVDTTNHVLKVKDGVFVKTTGANQTGTLKINETTKADGYFYGGTTDPTNSTRLNYDGYFYATRVYNAVYNDLAEFYEVDDEIIYGRAYTIKNGKLKLAKKGEYVVGIASDTYGFALGSKDLDKKVPIAISGIVLAYVDREYKSGTLLKVGRKGILTKANLFDAIFRPQIIAGYYFKKEERKVINKIKVNERHWVKVK